MRIEISDAVYADIIEQFFHEEFPSIECDKFEALSKQVFGTKQRRNGPMPIPEVQVAIRDILRRHEVITFFTPWGASKQAEGMKLDLLELCALKQLLALQEGLRRYGKGCSFVFRLENLGDRYLFGDGRQKMIADYVGTFVDLVTVLEFEDVHPELESFHTSYGEFEQLAESYLGVFYDYLLGKSEVESLAAIGWKGIIPAQQRRYYTNVYKTLYPDRDPNLEMAKYFAATLARVQLDATCLPQGEVIVINFNNPIPGSVMTGNRLYYRSIPEHYTHNHCAPWMGKGYLSIDEEGNCCPKIGTESREYIENQVSLNGVQIQCDYVLE